MSDAMFLEEMGITRGDDGITGKLDVLPFQFDIDAGGAGIDRVLDQFLDHRRRPLDDFAGGDLVDEGVGKLADRHVLAAPGAVSGNQR